MKKRTHNLNFIKTRKSYSIATIAKLYQLHKGTVRNWIKQGLTVIDTSKKPYLIMGDDLKCFLKERRDKRKHPLKIGEFFCAKCHCATRSHPDKVFVKYTNKKLGKTYRQAVIKGVCEICGQSLTRFSSDREVEELRKEGWSLTEHKVVLIGNGDSSINVDIERRRNAKT